MTSFMKMAKPSIRWAFNWLQWEPSESEFMKAISCIQIEEKNRLDRFVFRKDARASLAGRLLMRKFVNDYGGFSYEKILFYRDQNGRPTFNSDNIKLNFNVSHQGSYTVLAGEIGDVLIGVDVMKLEYTGGKDLKEFFRIMNRNFSPSEWVTIRGDQSATDIDQVSMFCRHWALKESYVKAIGVGIAMDLSKLSFKVNSQLLPGRLIKDTELYLDGVKQNWLFEESLIDPNHCVAVALQENNSPPVSRSSEFEEISFDKLVENSVPLHSSDFEYCKRYFAKPEKP